MQRAYRIGYYHLLNGLHLHVEPIFYLITAELEAKKNKIIK